MIRTLGRFFHPLVVYNGISVPSCCSSLSLKEISLEGNDDKDWLFRYLTQSLGFSAETARTTAVRLKIQSPDMVNRVIAVFNKYEFSEPQFSKLVKTRPQVLRCNPEKSILPKLELLFSLGIEPHEAARIICSVPGLLTASLENKLIPSLTLMARILEPQTDIRVFLKRNAYSLLLSSSATRNLETLIRQGVPSSKLSFWFKCPQFLSGLNRSTNIFDEVVEKVHRFGFNPSTTLFSMAVLALGRYSKLWDKKAELYVKCGWSMDEFMSAFRRYPHILSISDSKITAKFDFLVGMMAIKPSALANYPAVLSMSLENRIIPRANYIQILVSKGLVKRTGCVRKMFLSGEKVFLENFVHRFEQSHDLLKLYTETINKQMKDVEGHCFGE